IRREQRGGAARGRSPRAVARRPTRRDKMHFCATVARSRLARLATMPGPAAPDLTLYAESSWLSPWLFHPLVALEEKQLPYRVEVVSLPLQGEIRAAIEDRALVAKVPVLVHGDVWITESLAISEYLAETFPAPDHPRLFPADLAKRARARQIMSML